MCSENGIVKDALVEISKKPLQNILNDYNSRVQEFNDELLKMRNSSGDRIVSPEDIGVGQTKEIYQIESDKWGPCFGITYEHYSNLSRISVRYFRFEGKWLNRINSYDLLPEICTIVNVSLDDKIKLSRRTIYESQIYGRTDYWYPQTA